MNATYAAPEVGIACGEFNYRPGLVQLRAEPRFGPALLTTVFVVAFVGGLLGSAWVLAAVVAGVWWAIWLSYEKVFNRLEEPSVWVSATLQPGREAIVECDVQAKRKATVIWAAVEFESHESWGEDSHTERYGEVALQEAITVSSTQTTLRGPLPVPFAARRRWPNSYLEWYVALVVDVADGAHVRRRYRVKLDAD
jgi:hypothetical protein